MNNSSVIARNLSVRLVAWLCLTAMSSNVAASQDRRLIKSVRGESGHSIEVLR